MFRLLGPLEVTVDGSPIDPGPPKARVVLAALLLDAGSTVPVDRLVDAVWEGRPPRTAKHSIQVYVGELRKRLADAGLDARIETSHTGYRLDQGSLPVDVDVFDHEARAGIRALDDGDPATALLHLDAALAVWREPPLGEFAFAEFAQPAIRRLRSLHRDVDRARAAALLRAGGVREAIAALRRLVEEDHLDGESTRLLMLAACEAGNRVEALRAYEAHRRALAEDLGIEPTADVDRAYELALTERPSGEAARRNPFKGLRPFGESDAADFHGRAHEVAAVLGKLEAGAGVVGMVGPSGCGKSSIVRAGLLPAMRDGARDGRPRRTVVTMVPGRHPLAEPALTEVGSGRRSVLIVDQFEELYTLTGEDERTAFVDELLELAAGGVQVVATLRADFYDRVLADRRLAEIFSADAVDVLPLDPSGLEQAAREPARDAGLGLEDELVAELVAATARRPGSLPLFEYVLTELADRADGGVLTLDAYRAMGGVEGTLGRQADALYGRLPDPERRAVRQVLLRLTSAAGDPPTRRRVALAELSSLDLRPEVLDRTLDTLATARLVTFGRDPTGGPSVEVAHESLLVEWDRLAGWIREARDDLDRRRSLEAALADWRQVDRDPDYLPSGSRLADFEHWADTTDLVLTGEERAFLEEARRRQDARLAAEAAAEEERLGLSRRARRRLWTAIVSVTVLAAVGTFFLLSWLLAPGPPDVAVLVLEEDTTSTDASFGAFVRQGAATAAEDLGLDVRVVPLRPSTAGATVRELADAGVGLMVHVYAGNIPGVTESDMLVPGPAHVLVDFGPPNDHPDATTVLFRAEEGSFLVGVAAAETTETGRVGFVGGVEMPTIFAFEAGFEAGVAAVDPAIEVQSVYLASCPDFGGFASPSLGRLGAEAVLSEGADVVYQAAGDSGFGVLDAVERWSRDTGSWRWAIGVDRDQYADLGAAATDPFADVPGVDPVAIRSHILTSMVKRVDVAIHDVIADWAAGRLEPGVHTLGLAEGGVGFATSGGFIDPLVPELERWRSRIVDGEIEVPNRPAGRDGWECRAGPTDLHGSLAP